MAILLTWDVATTGLDEPDGAARRARRSPGLTTSSCARGAHGRAKQLDVTLIAFDEYSGHRDRDDRDHGSEISTTVSGPWKCANSVQNGREVVFVMASVAVYVRSSLRAKRLLRSSRRASWP
jgi:hypothetical protein